MNAETSFAQARIYAPEQPRPLVASRTRSPYPIDALGPLGPAAAAIAEITQAPVAIAAQSVLGATSLAAQGLHDAQKLDGVAPCSLFLLTIAKSGERKSSCDRLAMAAVRDFEAELAVVHGAETGAWRNRHQAWKARRERMLKKAGPDLDAEVAALDALGAEPMMPLLPDIIAGDPTWEGLTRNLENLRPSLGLFSDEGGVFLGGHSMKSENRLKTIAGLSRFWGGDPVDRWRAGDGVSRFTGRRLSLHLMLQPAVAGLLADQVMREQGILARMLMAEPPSAIGTRRRREPPATADAALTRFGARIGALLRRPLALTDGARNTLSPPVLPLSPDAHARLVEFHDELEAAQGPEGAYAACTAFASKTPEHAARIATVLGVFAGEPRVEERRLVEAATLARWHLEEARGLTGAEADSAGARDAESLRIWLVEKWTEPFISVRVAMQRGPSALRGDRSAMRGLFAALEDHGWLIATQGEVEIKGETTRDAWRVYGK